MNNSSFWGSGWSFPPTFDLANKQLQLVHKTANINQSINIILSTMRGERSMLPDFGSNLGWYLFKNIDATAQGEIIQSVKRSLLDHEPRIDVTDVSLMLSGDAEPSVEVMIAYSVRKTNGRYNHVFPFSVNEGTHLPKQLRG